MTIQMKATEFLWCCLLHKSFLTFEFVDEILKCDHQMKAMTLSGLQVQQKEIEDLFSRMMILVLLSENIEYVKFGRRTQFEA